MLNAGAALFIAGAVPTVQGGIARAAEAIDRGAAQRTLAHLVATSSMDPVAVDPRETGPSPEVSA